MVFPGSRYEKTGTFVLTRSDGTMVQSLRLPLPGPALVQGYYRRSDGQRLDLIANAFLKDDGCRGAGRLDKLKSGTWRYHEQPRDTADGQATP